MNIENFEFYIPGKGKKRIKQRDFVCFTKHQIIFPFTYKNYQYMKIGFCRNTFCFKFIFCDTPKEGLKINTKNKSICIQLTANFYRFFQINFFKPIICPYKWDEKEQTFSATIPGELLRYKPVAKYTLKNTLLEKYPSIMEAARKNNLDASTISKVCAGKEQKNMGDIFGNI